MAHPINAEQEGGKRKTRRHPAGPRKRKTRGDRRKTRRKRGGMTVAEAEAARVDQGAQYVILHIHMMLILEVFPTVLLPSVFTMVSVPMVILQIQLELNI